MSHELAHFGILGMKWGCQKKPNTTWQSQQKKKKKTIVDKVEH
jgi:hypothetical protein